LSRYDEALAALHEALAILERRLGPHHVRIAICRELIARLWFEQGSLPKARAMVTDSIAMYDKVLGGKDPDSRQALLLLGQIELKLGATERAIAPLERAYAFGANTDSAVYAQIEWSLGCALVETHRDPQRGMKLVRTARVEFESDKRAGPELIDLTRWLRRQR
jgi:tetratricopeptide (TPR) repeat protein